MSQGLFLILKLFLLFNIFKKEYNWPPNNKPKNIENHFGFLAIGDN
jgi:hypothetical protein